MRIKAWLGVDEICPLPKLDREVILAYHLWTRLSGLIYGNARLLLIPYCKIVHTFMMSYKLDIYFFDKDFNLLKKVLNTPANRIECCFSAVYVLEVPSNFKLGISDVNYIQDVLRQYLLLHIFL